MVWKTDLIVAMVTGSHLYGTARVDSDLDVRGVCFSPREALLGLTDFEQYLPSRQEAVAYSTEMFGRSSGDVIIYALNKFFKLCLDANPNILELLFVPQSQLLATSATWDTIVNERDLFLSTKIIYTFAGYACSQLKRIQRHKRWLDNTPEKPGPQDFGLVDDGKGGTRWTDSNQHDAYQSRLKNWQAYTTWRKNRNPARAVLERRYGFDCHDARTTEFLTEAGWQFYDAIDGNVQLATVNIDTGMVEMQHFTDRFVGIDDRVRYVFENQQTRCHVTAGHKMLVSDIHRSKANRYSTTYDDDTANWHLVPAKDLVAARKSFCHTRGTGEMREIDASIPNYDMQHTLPGFGANIAPDDVLRLMGLYVSDGTIATRKSGNKTLRISQKKDGRVEGFIDQYLPHVPFRKYEHDRGRLIEVTWTLHNPIAAWLIEQCGHGSRHKHLPLWTMNLSNRQSWVLLKAMISGDGTDRNKSYVYYTSSKGMTDSIQAMCVCCGITSQVWGPYKYTSSFTPDVESLMYQVYIRKPGDDRRVMPLVTSRHLQADNSGKTRVVCFSVPNKTLVTRSGGKVAIHGNSKHASHLYRLVLEAEELLTTGHLTLPLGPSVRGKVLAVLRGEVRYEDVVAMGEEAKNRLLALEGASPLPKCPDRKAAEQLLISLQLAWLARR